MDFIRRFYNILSIKQKSSFHFLVVMVFFGMILEILSLGSILPLLMYLTNPDSLNSIPLIKNLMKNDSVLVDYSVIIIGILCIFSLKTIFLTLISYFQSKICAEITADMGTQLYEGYLHQRYIYHLENNSSNMIRNIVTESSFILQLTTQATSIITEIILMFGLVVLLLIIQPLITTMILVFFAVLFLILNMKLLKLFRKWGSIRQLNEGDRIKQLQQGIDAIKDIKMQGSEEKMVDQFNLSHYSIAGVNTIWTFTRNLPKIYIEYLIVIIGIAVIFFLVTEGTPFIDLVPSLGIFAVTGFKLLPSFNRLVTGISNLNVNLPVVTMLEKEFKTFKDSDAHVHESLKPLKGLKIEDSISLQNISFTYDNTIKKFLTNVNMSIHRNETTALIGASGSGKSTIIDILMGLLEASKGNILTGQTEIDPTSKNWKKYISYVPQYVSLLDDTIRNNITFGDQNETIDENKLNKALEFTDLNSMLEKLPNGLETFIGEKGMRISGGQKQRIALSRALYRDFEILILDESTSALDYDSEEIIIKNIKNNFKNKIILVVSHRMSCLKYCDKVYDLNNGILSEVVDKKKLLEIMQKK